MTGKVKWYEGELNYGFIDGDDGESYFVHLHDIACWPKSRRSYKHLRHDDRVQFEVGPPAGENNQPHALNVEVTLSAEELKSWR